MSLVQSDQRLFDFFSKSLIFCIVGNPITSTFANSEDPDEVQHDAAFH